MNRNESRKAQVTVFIIIGIILLVSASIIIYVTQLRKVDVIQEVVVPPEVKPIYDYVTNCLYQIGKDGLDIIGTQGGYADLSPDRIDTREITMTPSAYVKIDPANLFKLPLWFYDGEWRIPSIEFMQSELANYVGRHIYSCINNFTAFMPSYEVTQLEPARLSSVVTEDDVAVILDYPISVKQGDKVTDHDKFISRIPVKLKKIHELAEGILREAHETEIFEKDTIDFMAMDPDVPMDPQGIEFGMREKTWRLDEVEKKVQKLIYYNIPRFRVKGTDYPPFSAPESVYEALKEFTMEDINEGRYPNFPTPGDAVEYNKMMIDPGIAGAEDMKVTFSYQYRWGMDLNALPNDGGILRSRVGPGSSFLSFIGINVYHFTYDVIYPVMARIRDPEAFAGIGYVFNFAFPVLIDDNKPNRQEFGVKNFEGYYIDTGFCEQPGGSEVEIRAIGIDESGFPMTSGLKEVNISYRCASRRCDLGATGYDEKAPGRYALITALPPGCVNPIIRASKPGYLPAEKQIMGDYVELNLVRLRKLPLSIVKHTYGESAEKLVPNSESYLRKGDQASVYFRMRGTQLPYDQYAIVTYENQSGYYIELAEQDAQYDIDVMLQNYDTLVGGYRAENLSISYSDFRNANEIVLNVFEYSPRPTQQNEERMTKMLTYLMAGEYIEELKPTFR